MGIGLALAGGLLSGAGQGIEDDVAQMVQERASDLAFQRTQTLQGQQQAFQGTQNDLSRKQQTDLQNSQQGFQGGENALNRQQQVDMENKRLAAQASEGAAGRANSMAIAQIGQDQVSPVGSPFQDNSGAWFQQYDDNTTKPLVDATTGKPIIGTMTDAKLDAARAEAAKVAGGNIKGFSGEDASKIEGYLRNGYTPDSSSANAPPPPSGASNPRQPPAANTSSDPLSQARAAIAAGADPSAVAARLKQLGIDPGGLEVPVTGATQGNGVTPPAAPANPPAVQPPAAPAAFTPPQPRILPPNIVTPPQSNDLYGLLGNSLTFDPNAPMPTNNSLRGAKVSDFIRPLTLNKDHP